MNRKPSPSFASFTFIFQNFLNIQFRWQEGEQKAGRGEWEKIMKHVERDKGDAMSCRWFSKYVKGGVGLDRPDIYHWSYESMHVNWGHWNVSSSEYFLQIKNTYIAISNRKQMFIKSKMMRVEVDHGLENVNNYDLEMGSTPREWGSDMSGNLCKLRCMGDGNGERTTGPAAMVVMYTMLLSLIHSAEGKLIIRWWWRNHSRKPHQVFDLIHSFHRFSLSCSALAWNLHWMPLSGKHQHDNLQWVLFLFFNLSFCCSLSLHPFCLALSLFLALYLSLFISLCEAAPPPTPHQTSTATKQTP